MAEHFVQPPHWEWYIVGYFFCAGLAGGLYTLATLLKLTGSPRDDAVVRAAFLTTFPLVAVCGILLTIDLGQPLRFWHMMIDTTPGHGGLNWKPWSPISLGTWALLVFGIFSFISFVLAYIRRASNTIFEVIGSLVALYVASYTGVVLSVSNQPVWSDSWAVGGLFVASALSGSAALLVLLARSRAKSDWSEERLHRADRYFVLLEAALIVVFFVTLAQAGMLAKTFSGTWLVVWILVFLSLVPALVGFAGNRRTLSAVAVLAGVLLMRYVVIFSAQS